MRTCELRISYPLIPVFPFYTERNSHVNYTLHPCSRTVVATSSINLLNIILFISTNSISLLAIIISFPAALFVLLLMLLFLLLLLLFFLRHQYYTVVLKSQILLQAVSALARSHKLPHAFSVGVAVKTALL